MDEYRDLLQTQSPDPVQLYALAGLLHSFYTELDAFLATIQPAATEANRSPES